MRPVYMAAGTALLLGIATGASSIGCLSHAQDDCEQNPILACFWTRLGYTVNGSSGAGGDGGTPPGCVPSENDAPVANECGVFVSSSGGDDGGEGTKEKPLKTLAAAVAMASGKGKPVYACAETFEEALVLDVSVELFGGLECSKGWAYIGDATKTTLTAGADAIPLVLMSGVKAARIEDFAVHAADAMEEGGSSIAVLADGAAAELVRCELVAGSGAKGAAGSPGDPNGMAAAGGAAGNAGKDACSDLDGMPGPDTTLGGGDAVVNDCGGDVSVGGNGGTGNVLFGGGAVSGQTGTAGGAGIGEPTMGMWECVAGSGLGNAGSSGAAGMPGAGAAGLGTISTSGYTGTSGGAGTPGTVGQGGGGGGGAKGGMICAPGNMTGSGASGGSGGAGGCGGMPGQGGGPGGASIALVSLQASITLTDCTLTSGKGGEGGPGGDAQPGGPGGDPGKGGQGAGVSNPGCSGGQGGKGGNGGPGGGGLGGASLGIAFQGTAPQSQGKTIVTSGTPGAGGPGGSANTAMNEGEAGVAAEQQEFP